jgi:hypothetical protein
VLLLLRRREIAGLTKVTIILGPDKEILAALARDPQLRQKVCFSASAEAHIDNRIGDEFPVGIAPPDDRPDLERVNQLRQPRQAVAEFEIQSVEEVALVRLRRHE